MAKVTQRPNPKIKAIVEITKATTTSATIPTILSVVPARAAILVFFTTDS